MSIFLLYSQKGNPLKLIIMSATLRLKDFTENTQLFKVTPPVIKVSLSLFLLLTKSLKCDSYCLLQEERVNALVTSDDPFICVDNLI